MLSIDLGIPFDELAQMPSSTFSLYKDLYSRKPWGDYRGDLQAAMIAKTAANHAGQRRTKPAALTDFLLDFDGSRAAQDDAGIDLEAEFFPTKDDS